MYLRKLTIENLKLLRNFEHSFADQQGKFRQWTVFIGENGTCKTALLQAIAMAAAGAVHVNGLAEKVVGQLRDRRCDDDGRKEDAMQITAEFSFSELACKDPSSFPMNPIKRGSRSAPVLDSRVSQMPGERGFRAKSTYVGHEAKGDPLDVARFTDKKLWFVAAYGVQRVLPEAGVSPQLQKPSIERLKPLFDPHAGLTSLAFTNYYEGDAERSRRFAAVLKRALLTAEHLLPTIEDLELRGAGGVRKAGDLLERNRFVQAVGKTRMRVPANSLSHGYQSTIAWIADFVGHVILEADTELGPEDMVGLVLVDELDLYLHPTWQVVLVRALSATFPKMQFVVTTHSPLVLAGLSGQKDEIVRLRFNEASGDVEKMEITDDPRLLTGTELFRRYFGIDDIHPDEAGRVLREYTWLAANPFRSSEDDRELAKMRKALLKEKITPSVNPVPRRSA